MARKGGINAANPAGARGDRFEALYRAGLCKTLADNKLFTAAHCAADGISRTPAFDEQIDLLVEFGGLCLVGEVKFLLMPADPHERERFSIKLEEAAKQAKRKTTALTKRPDVVASTFGVDVTEAAAFELLPVVVTNQNYGFSTRVCGCRSSRLAFCVTTSAGARF